MKVRSATISDLPNVVELGAEFFAQTTQAEFTSYNPTGVKDFLSTLLNSEMGAVFVAETDAGEMVGITGGLLYPLWMGDSHITGQELFWYVDPEHRKSKAGRRLFDALEKWAKDAGANSFNMVALSHLHEKRVGRMYESKGYRPMERMYTKEF